MGLLSNLAVKINERKAFVAERRARTRLQERERFRAEQKVLAEEKAYLKEKNAVAQLRKDVRAQKLAPLKNALKGFQGAVKKAGERQRQNQNNNLFGVTKSSDELLFGTKKKELPKQKKKKLTKVYFEYR